MRHAFNFRAISEQRQTKFGAIPSGQETTILSLI